MKTVMITGASRGIGLAIAQAFSQPDSDFDNIVLVARDGKRLDEAKQEVARIAGNKAVHTIVSDLGQPGFQNALFETVDALGLKLTSIINNAGFTAPCSYNDITEEDLDMTLQVNVKAPILIVRDARRRGHKLDYIVNISSTAGMNGRPNWTTYSASKAAILAASESMQEEFAPEGTEVLRISPGRCATDLRKTLAPDEDPTTIMQPSAVADGLRFMMSDQGKIIRHQNVVFR
ncbi:SDR family NAD(P)-dependent oxidoreductase [Pararhodobacter oceanensis]|uniref:SDR family NAD(P)-dependent oxidoreductase n=1 Tax=Pararhodobacter oceanensis TaxID=2172121 RepID=UPI003A8E3B7C